MAADHLPGRSAGQKVEWALIACTKSHTEMHLAVADGCGQQPDFSAVRNAGRACMQPMVVGGSLGQKQVCPAWENGDGLKDFDPATGKELRKGEEGWMGGKNFNIRNFMLQSSPEEIHAFLSLMGKTTIDKVRELDGKEPVGVYAFGGTRGWLHVRIEDWTRLVQKAGHGFTYPSHFQKEGTSYEVDGKPSETNLYIAEGSEDHKHAPKPRQRIPKGQTIWDHQEKAEEKLPR